MKNNHMFLKLFPQSFAIDEVLSKKLLEAQDYQLTELNHPILYRGDTRSPETIFKDGFKRRVLNNPLITEENESKSCVACSKDLVYAVGFADSLCSQDVSRYMKEEYSWVYAVHAIKGFDLSSDIKKRNEDNYNAAKLVNEVTLIHVPKENIIAAFQIKTTKNDIRDYFNKNYSVDENHKNNIAWQILVTDLRINPACTLQSENPELYAGVLAELTSLKNAGYYRIPWSPFTEECNPKYINMHLLTPYQKDALQKSYITSTEEAKKIIREEQVEALDIGLSKEKILTNHPGYADLDHFINAVKSGCSLAIVEKCNGSEAYGISKGLEYSLVKGLNECQIDGLVLGFTKKEVTSSWFTWDMTRLVRENKEQLEIIRESHRKNANFLKLFYQDNYRIKDTPVTNAMSSTDTNPMAYHQTIHRICG